MQETAAVAEARRSFEICNACRYCEGYCAVFPAMELRRAFSAGDLSYLANLCHGCRGCYYACQYAPPHHFNLNLPRALAVVRQESYAAYAWPAGLARVFERNGLVVVLATALGVAFALIATLAARAPDMLFASHVGPGAFYRIIPWGVMTALAGGLLVFALMALIIGGIKFWRDTGGGGVLSPVPLAEAAGDVLLLRNLGGGGHGCNDRDEGFSGVRRWLHQTMFYGFLLCFASTSVATHYDHWLKLEAPYPFWSLPVLLGTAGGLAMVIGTAGLIWLKITGDREPEAPQLFGGEMAMLVLLNQVAFTGLLLLALRATGAMGVLLALHLGLVLALFLLLPYSKMVHGVYRGLALLRARIERRTHASIESE